MRRTNNKKEGECGEKRERTNIGTEMCIPLVELLVWRFFKE